MARKRRNLIRQFSGKVPIPIIIGAVVVIVAVVGFLLYSQGKLSFLPSVPGVTRVTEKDFEFIDDPTVRKHMVAQANQTSYRTKTYSDAADLTFLMEIQIVGENFNTRDIEYQGKTKETKQKVQIGNTTYVKDYSDNKWWKQTLTPEDLPEEETESEPTDFKEEYSQPDLKFKSLGKEACGSLTCFKYEQLNQGLKRTFWFDERDYLLRKEKVTQAEFSTDVEYSYDNINIAAPSPTKDVPAGKNVYDYYYGAASTNYSVPQNTQQNYTPPQDLNLDSYSPPSEDEIGY